MHPQKMNSNQKRVIICLILYSDIVFGAEFNTAANGRMAQSKPPSSLNVSTEALATKFNETSRPITTAENRKSQEEEEAKSEGFHNFFQGGSIGGYLRTYYFTRDYANPVRPDQAAFSAGGAFNVLSGGFLKFFRAGATAYTAQPLDLNNRNPLKVDNTLPGYSITVPGQSFLEFNHKKLFVKGGNILVDTPWINPSDNRMIPSIYSGAFSTYQLTDSIILTGLRLFRFKSHVKSNFNRNTLYNPTEIGGMGLPKLAGVKSNGALAFGLQQSGLKSEASVWYYQFYDYATMFYGHAKAVIPLEKPGLQWILRAQALTESATGANFIQQATKKRVGSTAYGALIGLNFSSLTLSIAGNFIPLQSNHYRGGDLITPYTAGYATDPLFTTSMIGGLVEKAAGKAVKAALLFRGLDERLLIQGSFAKYFTQPVFVNTRETDLDITYWTRSDHIGFVIRNRFGVQQGATLTGRFIYNRVMLSYLFS
ncbi:MAG: hypothetical protein WC785_00790 [Tatlockia sp.]|jgi:hypothetical protein